MSRDLFIAAILKLDNDQFVEALKLSKTQLASLKKAVGEDAAASQASARADDASTAAKKRNAQASREKEAAAKAQAKADREAAAAAARAAAQMRASSVNLGQQIQDVTQQAALGVSPLTIFAQQGGQVAYALSGMGGVLGRVAGFLSGPWGAAVLGAITIATSFGVALWQGGKAAESKEKAVDALAKAIETVDRATQLANKTEAESLRLSEITIRQSREKTAALLAEARAKLAKSQADLADIQTNAGTLDPSGQLSGSLDRGIGLQKKAIADLTAELDTLDGKLRGVSQWRLDREVLAGFDGATAAAQRQGLALDELYRKYAAGLLLEGEYKAERRAIEERYRAELDAIDRSRKAEQAAAAARRAMMREATRDAETFYDKLITGSARAMGELQRQFAKGLPLDFNQSGFTDPAIRDFLDRDRDQYVAGQQTRRDASGEDMRRIIANARENVQRGIGDAIYAALSGDKAKISWKTFADIGRRALADALAARIAKEGLFDGLFDVLLGQAGSAQGEVKGKGDAADKLVKATEKNGNIFKGELDRLRKAWSEGLGSFVKALGGFVGKIGGAAIQGAAYSGLPGLIGLKTSSTGGAVGGVLGSVLGPHGAIIGSIIGSTIGGLLKSTPKATATLSTGGSAVSGSSKLTGTVRGVADSVLGALDQVASQLNGTLADSLSFGSITAKGKNFYYDPTGAGNTKAKRGAVKFGSAEEASAYAIQQAIAKGAVTGLSAAVAQALRSSDDINKALAEAVKVQDLEKLLKSGGNPFEQLFRELEAGLAERVRIAKAYGFDLVALEQRNAEDRAKALDAALRDQIGSVKDLLDEFRLGGRSAGSDVERLAALKAERDRLVGLAAGGDADASSRLASVSAQIDDLAIGLFGKAGGYAGERQATVSALEQVVSAVEAMARQAQVAAQAPATAAAAPDPQLAEANQTLDEIVLQLQRQGVTLAGLPVAIGSALTGVGGGGGLGGLVAAYSRSA